MYLKGFIRIPEEDRINILPGAYLDWQWRQAKWITRQQAADFSFENPCIACLRSARRKSY